MWLTPHLLQTMARPTPSTDVSLKERDLACSILGHSDVVSADGYSVWISQVRNYPLLLPQQIWWMVDTNTEGAPLNWVVIHFDLKAMPAPDPGLVGSFILSFTLVRDHCLHY